MLYLLLECTKLKFAMKGSYFCELISVQLCKLQFLYCLFFQYSVSLETGRVVPKLIEGNGQEVPAKQQM